MEDTLCNNCRGKDHEEDEDGVVLEHKTDISACFNKA